MSLVSSTSNTAETVLEAFQEAGEKYGIPSRVRGDRGGENLKVAVYMIRHRGLNRASFMFGTSTRNTRIERLWGEVGSQFARRWRGFFQRLEREYYLDRHNPHHLWLLQELFLGELQQDCTRFLEDWNRHGVSGLANGQSPEVSGASMKKVQLKWIDVLPQIGHVSARSARTRDLCRFLSAFDL